MKYDLCFFISQQYLFGKNQNTILLEKWEEQNEPMICLLDAPKIELIINNLIR